MISIGEARAAFILKITDPINKKILSAIEEGHSSIVLDLSNSPHRDSIIRELSNRGFNPTGSYSELLITWV